MMSVHLDLEILIFMFDIILAAIQKMNLISLIFSLVVVRNTTIIGLQLWLGKISVKTSATLV